MTDGSVLASFAHPDDAEIACGGTLAKWADRGRDVHLLVLTNGDKGSNDASRDPAELAETRLAETERAADVLGLASFRVLPNPDGELANDKLVRGEVVRTIRDLRPETVVACDPTAWFFEDVYYNHADHRTAGAITLDAVFPGAGNPHFFPEQVAGGLEAWQVHDVWIAWTQEPNHREDVSGFMERKIAALKEHKSQVEGGMLGYFEDWLQRDAEEEGRRIGAKHAEAFRVLKLE